MSASWRPTKRQKRKNANNGGQKVSSHSTTLAREEKARQIHETKQAVEGKPIVVASKTKRPSNKRTSGLNSSIKQEESVTPSVERQHPNQHVPSTTNDVSSSSTDDIDSWNIAPPPQQTVAASTTTTTTTGSSTTTRPTTSSPTAAAAATTTTNKIGVKIDKVSQNTPNDTTPSSSAGANNNSNTNADASHPIFSLLVASEIQQATAPDEDGDTPLHIAVSQSEVDMVHQLLYLISMSNQSVDPINNLHQTPLHLAIITKQPELVADLVQAGADPNICDRNGNTSMHLACIHKCPPILYALLQCSRYSPQLKTKNFEGYIPLHLAVIHGDAELVNVLVRNIPTHIDCKDTKNGWTALFHAAANDVEEIIEILLRAGPDINCQSYSGNTALHIASGRGYTEVVRRLMQSGADMSMRNSHRESAAMITTNRIISNLLHGKDYRPRSPTLTSRPSVNIRPPAQPRMSSQSQNSGWPLTIISPSEKMFNPFSKQGIVTSTSSSSPPAAVATSTLTPPNTQIVLKSAKPVTSGPASVLPVQSTSHISQDQIAHLLRAAPRAQTSNKPNQQPPVVGYPEYVTASEETMSAVTSAIQASSSIPVTVLLQEPHGPLELLNAVAIPSATHQLPHAAATILSESNHEMFPVSKTDEQEMELNLVEIQSTNPVSQDCDTPVSVSSNDPPEESTANKSTSNTDEVPVSPQTTANEKMQSIADSTTEVSSGATEIVTPSASPKGLLNEENISTSDCKEGNNADGLSTKGDHLKENVENKVEKSLIKPIVSAEQIPKIENEKCSSADIIGKTSELLDNSDVLSRSEQSSKVDEVISAFKEEASNSDCEKNSCIDEQNIEQCTPASLSDSKRNSVNSDIASLEKGEEKDCIAVSINEVVDCLQQDTALQTENKNIDCISDMPIKIENVQTADTKQSACKEKMVLISDQTIQSENHCISSVNDDNVDIGMHETGVETNIIDLKSPNKNKEVNEKVSGMESTSPDGTKIYTAKNEGMSLEVPSRHQEIQEKLRKHITGKKTKTLSTVKSDKSEEVGQIAGALGIITPAGQIDKFPVMKVSSTKKSGHTDETEKTSDDIGKNNISNEMQLLTVTCVEQTSIEKEQISNNSLQIQSEASISSPDISLKHCGNLNEHSGENSVPTEKEHSVLEQSPVTETQIVESLDKESASRNGKQTLNDAVKNNLSMASSDIQAVSPDGETTVSTKGGEEPFSNETIPRAVEGITKNIILKENEIDKVLKSRSMSSSECINEEIEVSEKACNDSSGINEEIEVSEKACNDSSGINEDFSKRGTSLHYEEIEVSEKACNDSSGIEHEDFSKRGTSLQYEVTPETSVAKQQKVDLPSTKPHDTRNDRNNIDSSPSSQSTSTGLRTPEIKTSESGNISEKNNTLLVLELSNDEALKLHETTNSDESKDFETQKRSLSSNAQGMTGDNVIKGDDVTKETRKRKSPPPREHSIDVEEMQKRPRIGKYQLSEEQKPPSVSKQGSRKDVMIPKKRKYLADLCETDSVKSKADISSTENSLSKSWNDNLSQTSMDTADSDTAVSEGSETMQVDYPVKDGTVRSPYQPLEYTLEGNGSETVKEKQDIDTSKTTNTSQPQSTLSTAQALLSLGDPRSHLLSTAVKLKPNEESTESGDSVSTSCVTESVLPIGFAQTTVTSSSPVVLAKDPTLDLPASTGSSERLEATHSGRTSPSVTKRASPLDAAERVSVIVYPPQETKKRPKSTSSLEHEPPIKQAHLDVAIPRASSTSPRLIIPSAMVQSIKPQSPMSRPHSCKQDDVHSIPQGLKQSVYHKDALSVHGCGSVDLGSVRSGNSSILMPTVANSKSSKNLSHSAYRPGEPTSKASNKVVQQFDLMKMVSKTSVVDTPKHFVYSQSPHPSYTSKTAISHVPHVVSQVPHIVSHVPHIVSQQMPHMVSQVPNAIVQGPHFVTQGHHIIAQGPRVIAQGAHAIAQGSDAIPQGPHIVTQVGLPHVVSQVPNVISPGPHGISHIPHHFDSRGAYIISQASLSNSQGTATHGSNLLPQIAFNVPHQLGTISAPSHLVHHFPHSQDQHQIIQKVATPQIQQGAIPQFIVAESPTPQAGTVFIQQPYQARLTPPTTSGSKYTSPHQSLRGVPIVVQEPTGRAGELSMGFSHSPHMLSHLQSQVRHTPSPIAYKPHKQMPSLRPRMPHHTTILQSADPDQPIDLSCKKKPEEPLDMSIASISRQTGAGAPSIAHVRQSASSLVHNPPVYIPPRSGPETSTPFTYLPMKISSAQLLQQQNVYTREPYLVRKPVYDGYESDERQLFIDETVPANDVGKRPRTFSKKGGKRRHSRLDQRK